MDQASSYLSTGLYYGLNAGLVICFVIIMGHFIWHKQWLFTLLSLVFMIMYGGFVIALVIGWQEAKPWKITNLMRVYTVLLVLCLVMFVKQQYRIFTTAPPPVDPKVLAKQKAGKHH